MEILFMEMIWGLSGGVKCNGFDGIWSNGEKIGFDGGIMELVDDLGEEIIGYRGGDIVIEG